MSSGANAEDLFPADTVSAAPPVGSPRPDPWHKPRVSGSQNESHFGRAIRAILRAVNRSFGSSLSLSPYPWRARGIASKVISYTCRSIGSG